MPTLLAALTLFLASAGLEPASPEKRDARTDCPPEHSSQNLTEQPVASDRGLLEEPTGLFAGIPHAHPVPAPCSVAKEPGQVSSNAHRLDPGPTALSPPLGDSQERSPFPRSLGPSSALVREPLSAPPALRSFLPAKTTTIRASTVVRAHFVFRDTVFVPPSSIRSSFSA